MNLKSITASALIAVSTMVGGITPEAQAKNVYCDESRNGIEYCFSRIGYEAWSFVAQDRDSYDGVEADVNCLNGRVTFYSNDGFDARKVRSLLHDWCLDQM